MLTQKFKSEGYDIEFSRKKRLANPNEFKAVFQAARKISSKHFGLYFRKNHLDYARLGIVIAKRNIRKAVTRNLIKRIIRERFRLNQAKLAGFDVIVVVYGAFGLLSREEMHKTIEYAILSNKSHKNLSIPNKSSFG